MPRNADRDDDRAERIKQLLDKAKQHNGKALHLTALLKQSLNSLPSPESLTTDEPIEAGVSYVSHKGK